jgi:hypothetical protein
MPKPFKFPFIAISFGGVNPNEKDTSLEERSRAAGSLFCALVLAVVAALFLLSGSKLFAWAAALPALLVGLLLYAAIHALLASVIPRTTIVLGEEPLRRGVSTSIHLRQAGPVSLQSLRANLICERIERAPGAKGRSISYRYQINFLNAGPLAISRLHVEEISAELTVPSEADPSCETPRLKIRWRIEIWGKRGSDPMTCSTMRHRESLHDLDRKRAHEIRRATVLGAFAQGLSERKPRPMFSIPRP